MVVSANSVLALLVQLRRTPRITNRPAVKWSRVMIMNGSFKAALTLGSVRGEVRADRCYLGRERNFIILPDYLT